MGMNASHDLIFLFSLVIWLHLCRTSSCNELLLWDGVHNDADDARDSCPLARLW